MCASENGVTKAHICELQHCYCATSVPPPHPYTRFTYRVPNINKLCWCVCVFASFKIVKFPFIEAICVHHSIGGTRCCAWGSVWQPQCQRVCSDCPYISPIVRPQKTTHTQHYWDALVCEYICKIDPNCVFHVLVHVCKRVCGCMYVHARNAQLMWVK